MANTNNCEQCNTVPSVPVTPPPTCPTPACDEYVSSDCVSSTVDGNCTSEFYQFDAQTGALNLDVNGNPISQDPPIPLGISFNQNDSLTTILQAMTAAQNCMFNPNYIAGMLQTIQANPQHPVSQIFCNMVCSCSCDTGCKAEVVETVTFPTADITTTGFKMLFTALGGYTYLIEVTDTNAPTPTVYHYQFSPIPAGGSSAVVTFDTTSLLNQAGQTVLSLPSGHTFEVVITSIYNGESCPSDSFTTATLQSNACTCIADAKVVLALEAAAVGNINLVITLSNSQVYLPQAYAIEVFDPNNNSIFGGPVDFDPTLYLDPPPANRVLIIIGGNPGTLAGGDYYITVTPVCYITPTDRCVGDTKNITATVTGPAKCAAPDITNVTIS
jgi:hypothetical protein